jgi:hypothetical protein
MTTNKTSDRQEETKQIPDHPLTDIAGKFGGKCDRNNLTLDICKGEG